MDHYYIMSKLAFFDPCFLSLALYTASIYGALAIYSNYRSGTFTDTFTTIEQKQMYEIVKKEHVSLYYKALLIASVIGLIYIMPMYRRGQKIIIVYFLY